MNKIVIDAFIGQEIYFENIGNEEFVPIYFDADAPLVDEYEFKLWNSDKKNSEIVITGTPIEISGNRMTLLIKPKEQNIAAGTYYFEIHNKTDKRIYFKGKLTVNL